MEDENAMLGSDKVNLNSNRTRILIVDDHPLVCIAIRKIFEDYPEFEIVGEASDGEEAVNLASKLLPDLIIMDISMPKLNGLEATQEIKRQHPKILILILTVHSDIEHISGIFNAGADGYFMKTARSDEIILGIRGLISGDAVLSANVFKQIVKSRTQYPTAKALNARAVGKITKREIEVLTLAAHGLSNKEIALRVNISIPTVKNHFTEIFSKLNTNGRTESVIKALRAGLITIGDSDKVGE